MKKVDSLKYQQQKLVSSGDEIATIKSRYKKPDGEKSIEMIQPIPNREKEFQAVSSKYPVRRGRCDVRNGLTGLEIQGNKLV